MKTFVIVFAILLMVLIIDSSPVPEPRRYGGYGSSSESRESSEERYPRRYGGRRDFLDFGSVGVDPRYSGYNGYNGYNRNNGYNNGGLFGILG